MPTTSAGIRYPASSASINIPLDLQNLAEDVDTYVQAQVGNAATASNTLTLTNKTLTSPFINGTGIVFEGTTDDAFETTLFVVDPTADRTILLPNTSGTLATLTDLSSGLSGGVTETDTQTLTNKTLTSPVLGGTTTTASGNLVLDPSTKIVEIRGDGASITGQIQLNCHANTHGQKINSQAHYLNATNTLTLPGGNVIGNANAVLVSDTGTQTLTNKTIPQLDALEISVIMAAF